MLPSQETAQAPRLILYIEDNLANLALVEALLSRRQELTLITARTGNQGIVLAGARQPDVILMDINLPDISGFDALKSLLDQSATANIPVMALSSNAYPRQIEQGIEAGFFRYLTKPFKLAEFTDALNACLALVAERDQASHSVTIG